MAYDEMLADRVRTVLGEQVPFGEIKMFGGLCFTVNGNMALGVLNEDLMVRVGPDAYEVALTKAGARPMDFTKRPMNGYVFVGRDGTTTDGALRAWARMALALNARLPAKTAKRSSRSAR